MESLRFKCPSCESDKLGMTQTNCMVVFDLEYHKDTNTLDSTISSVEYTGDEETCYQCNDCGEVLEGVSTPEEMIKWLREHQPAANVENPDGMPTALIAEAAGQTEKSVGCAKKLE